MTRVIVSLSIMLVAIQAEARDLPVQGGIGGASFRHDCSTVAHHRNRANWLRGFRARSGLWLDQISAICSAHDPDSNTFAINPITHFPPRGGPGGAPQEAMCDPDRYISSIAVHRRDERNNQGPNAIYLDAIRITCTSLSNPRDSLQSRCVGSYCVDSRFFDSPGQVCRYDEAAIGVRGRSGIYVDAIGLICGPKPRPEAPAEPAEAQAPADAQVPANPQAQADCESNGNEWNPQTRRCIKILKKPKFVVLQPTTVYDAPDGVGNEIGELTKDTEIRAKCGENSWCEFLFGPEARKAFVYSGPGHISLERR